VQRPLLALAATGITLAVLLGTCISSATAFGGLHGHGHCCPQCDAICVPVPEVQKEKHHCFEVECKTICIPAIKWPWQSCCEPPRCGKVKTVKVLKRVEYECEHCGYKWEVQSACGKCGHCGDK
jgi:hypothetical protein